MNARSKNQDTAWVDVTVVATTEKAVLLHNGKLQSWVPRSQIVDSEDELERGVATKVEMAVSVLEEKELV